jgi:hypothetical protein
MKNMRLYADTEPSAILRRGAKACVVIMLALLTQGFGFGTMFWSKKSTNYASYRNVIMKDNPSMGYWRLGDASGASAVDSSLAGNNGTLIGGYTLAQTGAIQNNTNRAITFNGSTGEISTAVAYSGKSTLSIEVWFKTTAVTSGIMAFWNGGSHSPDLYINGSGQVVFYHWISAGYSLTSPSAYNNGQWHHVVGTVGASGSFLYVDGVQVATNGITSHWTGSAYWRIGRAALGGYFNGTLDEVAAYSYQLTAAQVQSHYRAGLQKGLTVNRHCLDILNNGNSTGNGIYTIYPNGGSTALSVYCNMSDQGGGWTLIGRGRNNWAWTDAGTNTGSVHLNVGTTSAFTPAYYSAATVNQILEYRSVKDLKDGILLRRSKNTTGTSWQYYKWFLTSQTSWTWVFDASYPTQKAFIDGTQYPAWNTQDACCTEYPNGFERIFTWAWGGHCYQKGFSFGVAINTGANNATNYLWQCSTEAHAIPYTEVYVRQNNDVGNEAVREWVAVAQTTTYAGAVSICAGRGKKLCTRAQYCPYGSAGWELPWGGSRGASDQWAPVSEPVNDWVQVGASFWPTCQLHSELQGQIYGMPGGWASDGATAHGFRNYIMCCE